MRHLSSQLESNPFMGKFMSEYMRNNPFQSALSNDKTSGTRKWDAYQDNYKPPQFIGLYQLVSRFLN